LFPTVRHEAEALTCRSRGCEKCPRQKLK